MKFQSVKIIIYLLILCCLQVGISLIWMQPDEINPDSYYYVSIANYYLLSPVVHVRDAFTVGPVIPALVAATKFLTLKFVNWSPDVDIAVLKALSFCSYVVMILSAYRVMLRHIDRKMAFVVVFFVLGLLGCVRDTLSLNGELVAVALLSVLMVVLQQQQRSTLRCVAIAILSVSIAYTKLQAVPLLMLLLASEANNRKELVVILLYASSALFIAEFLLYLNGAGLVRNFVHMYIYVTKGAARGAAPHGLHEGFFSAITYYFSLLAYMLLLSARHFSFVYAIVPLIFFGNVGARKNLFSDWRVWLGVTAVTIFVPGLPYEHYLLFLLPFVFRFAGPAVAGIQGAVITQRIWRYFQAGMAIFLLLELYSSVQTVNPYRWNWNGALPKFAMGKNMDDVRALIKRNPGTIFVNGWDYRVHCYLNTYSTWGELSLVMAGAITEPEYVNNFVMNKFDYLIDVINYSGVTRNKNYALSAQGMEGAVVARYYDLAYDQADLRVYKRKIGQQPSYIALSGPRPIAFSLVNLVPGCKDCLADPRAGGVPGAASSGAFVATPGTATGDFVVSFVPLGSITQIRYSILSIYQSLQGPSIDVYNECDDGRRIKRSIDMKNAESNAVNNAYFDNGVCRTRLIRLHFKNEDASHGQWLDLVGVNGY